MAGAPQHRMSWPGSRHRHPRLGAARPFSAIYRYFTPARTAGCDRSVHSLPSLSNCSMTLTLASSMAASSAAAASLAPARSCSSAACHGDALGREMARVRISGQFGKAVASVTVVVPLARDDSGMAGKVLRRLRGDTQKDFVDFELVYQMVEFRGFDEGLQRTERDLAGHGAASVSASHSCRATLPRRLARIAPIVSGRVRWLCTPWRSRPGFSPPALKFETSPESCARPVFSLRRPQPQSRALVPPPGPLLWRH